MQRYTKIVEKLRYLSKNSNFTHQNEMEQQFNNWNCVYLHRNIQQCMYESVQIHPETKCIWLSQNFETLKLLPNLLLKCNTNTDTPFDSCALESNFMDIPTAYYAVRNALDQIKVATHIEPTKCKTLWLVIVCGACINYYSSNQVNFI